ncbi:hypothetical protein Sjap_022212 [Stephania japonica]|uniref:Uncharacterized protein n=1 Tax=Stephania japonica TaxID=461633 RepID=A0AAP0ENI1_9MAGN
MMVTRDHNESSSSERRGERSKEEEGGDDGDNDNEEGGDDNGDDDVGDDDVGDGDDDLESDGKGDANDDRDSEKIDKTNHGKRVIGKTVSVNAKTVSAKSSELVKGKKVSDPVPHQRRHQNSHDVTYDGQTREHDKWLQCLFTELR